MKRKFCNPCGLSKVRLQMLTLLLGMKILRLFNANNCQNMENTLASTEAKKIADKPSYRTL